MKFYKKIITVAMAGIMSLSMLGSLAVNAEETKDAEKIYKLSELMPMSQEEFLKLPNAEKLYNRYVNIDENIDFKDTQFISNTRVGGYYKPYYTEKEIMELLDVDLFDGFRLVIASSPAYSTDYYDWYIMVANERDRDFEFDLTMTNDDYILRVVKANYCLSQVAPDMFFFYMPLGSNPTSYGDANDDNKLNISDAAFIAKKIAQRKANELPEKADINNDGKVNLRDSVYIARLMNARHLAKADGLFE